MLDPISRGAIVATSALCVFGVTALAPLRARSSLPEFFRPPVAHNADPGPVAGPTVAVIRDPFAQPTPAAPTPVAATAPALLPWHERSLEPLPGNLASDEIPAIPGSASTGSSGAPTAGVATAGAARVTAIVTGLHPYAMIENGGVHTLTGLGDRVAGSPIVAITIDGVRLANGTVLAVARRENR